MPYNDSSENWDIQNNTLLRCKLPYNEMKGITIPNYVDDEAVLKIGDKIFADNDFIKAVYVPEGITSVGKEAFYNSSIQRVVLPSTLEVVDDYAFYNCNDLVEVEYRLNRSSNKSNSLTIGELSFYNCSFKYIPSLFKRNIKSIGSHAFYGCEHLQGAMIENDTILGPCAFESTGLKQMIFKQFMNDIPYGLFANCKELEVVYFDHCSTKMIGGYSFYNCKALRQIELPNTVVKIDECCFFDCVNLNEVELGPDVSHIGEHAFSYGSPVFEEGFEDSCHDDKFSIINNFSLKNLPSIKFKTQFDSKTHSLLSKLDLQLMQPKTNTYQGLL